MDVFRRFWQRYAARHYRSYALGFVFLLATTGLTVMVPTFVEYAVDAIRDNTASDAVVWAWAIIAAGLGVMVVRTLSRILFFNPGREIEYHLRNDLFSHLAGLPKRYFDQTKPGEIISRGTNDTAGVRVFVGFGSLQLGNVILTLIITIGKMFETHAMLTLACIVPLIGALWVMQIGVRRMFSLSRRSQEQVATLSARVLESYEGATVLQSFDGLPGAQAKFDRDNEEMLAIGVEIARVTSWFLPIVSVVGNLCVVVLLYLGGGYVGESLTLGELAAFAVYIRIVVGGLTGMGWLLSVVQRGWISLKRVYEVLDVSTEASASPRAMPPRQTAGRSLEVSGLTFTHPAAAAEVEPALRDVSLKIRPGETLGVFGLTGSGKTTLLNVLARIYEPPANTVFVDGVDITTTAKPDYWSDLAYVPQDAFLFSQSLADNVGLSAPGEPDPARIQQAVADAALAVDLNALPDGLDTVVGERGITLSGGQRQRTALARAFYRDFGWLLLDDVLSAVDHATEKKLIDAIYGRGAGRTKVIVSHRISALRHAEQIVVLDAGSVVAQGTHDELIGGKTAYAKAWKLQREEGAAHG